MICLVTFRRDGPFVVYVLQMSVSNKVELSRNLRSGFFLAALSSSLFVCHMSSHIHPSALSVKAFDLWLLMFSCDCLYLEAFSFECLLFTAHSS